MAEEKDTAFKNIDYKNKAKAVPRPVPNLGIDIDHDFYTTVSEAAQQKTLDIGALDSFTGVARSRDQVYSLLDMMSEDPIISSALEIYASDACEPNEEGKVVWVESADSNVISVCNKILDDMNADKNSFGWVYSLVKYGDLYLKLYRDSEVNKRLEKETLNEDVTFKAYSKNDSFTGYVEAVKNPANIFDLVRYGKTYAYIAAHTEPINGQHDSMTMYGGNYQFNYTFDKNDVDVYEATEYVHATLDDTSTRVNEEVTITSTGETGEVSDATYSVKKGKSVLYDSFKIWRELSLLENAVILSRLTRSSIVRAISVEVGDMGKEGVRNLLGKIKSMVEQKSAISQGNSLKEYTNPGAMENIIYIPVHDGKGTITASQIGGDGAVSDSDLGDLKYWKKKLFSSLGIPGQYLGDTEDSTGFNGGTSLSLISSRYAKSIKRIQNSYCQALESIVNIMLLNKGLKEYVGKFSIRMQAPTTQEEKDRKDNLGTTISNAERILSMVDSHIEDPAAKLNIFKSILSTFVTDQDVIAEIQDQYDKLTATETEEEIPAGEPEEDIFGGDDFGGGDFDLGGGSEDIGDIVPEGESQPLDLGPEEEIPNESFYTNDEGELLMENNLPSFSDLHINYNSIK